MTIDELEQLIRRYFSTGVAVVVIAIGPGTQAPDPGGRPGGTTVVRVEPAPVGGGSGEAGAGPATASGPRAAPADAGHRGATASDGESGTAGGGSRSGVSSSDPGSSRSDATRDGSSLDSDVGAAGRDLDEPEPEPGSEPEPGAGSVDDGSGPTRDPEEAAPEVESEDGPADSVPGSLGEGGSGPSTRAGEAMMDGPSAGSGDMDRSIGNESAGAGAPVAGATTGARAGGAAGGTAGTTAAERYGWGTPNRADEFDGGTEQWSSYDGPGYAGRGTRSPGAVSVENGVLTITGDSAGTTGGLAWGRGQKYGRWEGRVRVPAGDPSYNALLLLWPDAQDFPVGGEIDFMEVVDPARQKTGVVVHYGEDNSQVHGEVEIDATRWHNWAVEWTPESITAYVDGEEWYRTTDTSVLPPGPMHLCIQLDWFPRGGTPAESRMEVDWVRQYPWDGTGGTSAQDPDAGPRPGG
ncbi:glycoside hydrolase family 16 protein [Pseudonocardia bannensis]|uniref:Glycoside hydrolase family 16 protein n=1 Tax=Pseudonocardia bannensis TaxID=630973 RepID=A0A848DKR0_9PSEU|nr:glycoside hydrolase family 16 protein [Pseudonocardia bannensis]NMH93307.1 glycoside hydrolase family 16 protein [Pseudonocardia bannensis]